MAAFTFTNNTYAGEVLEDLLVYTAHGNDTYQAGLIHVVPGIQKKKALPSITLGEIIQDNIPTPRQASGSNLSADSKGAYTITERYLEPQDFMVYLEFNPRDFEEYWRPFQPEGALIFRELDPKVQAKMLRLLIDKKDQYINDSIWCGRKGGVDAGTVTTPAGGTDLGGLTSAGPMKYFDGAVARVLTNIAASTAAEPSTAQKAEKASGEVILAGDATLADGEAVEAALYAMWKKCPKNVRKNSALKFIMSWEDWDKYDEYLTAKDFKYVENPDVNHRRFKGKQIVVINGIPEHTIMLGKFNTGMDSCLWMGVDYAGDEDAIKVERLQANSELYFFQMRLKMDVNIVLPGEIVVWTAYKNK